MWESELKDILPNATKAKSRDISYELIRSDEPNYVFKDLLNNRESEAKQKIEKSILHKTIETVLEKSKPYPNGFNEEKVIENARKLVNYNEISDSYRKG